MLSSVNRKAVLVMGDFRDLSSIKKSDCVVIQDFSYVCEYPRNDAGKPYGNTNGSTMKLVIRIDNVHRLQSFYEKIRESDSSYMSLLFNALYDNDNMLGSYDQATVVDGYVVDITEKYDKETTEGQEHQMLATLLVLMKSVTYVTENQSLTQVISR